MSNLLEKASILLTPTGYDNGSMNSIKPIQTLGSELVTNGDFATDSDWVEGTGWTISGGTANQDGSNGILRQSNVVSTNTKVKITFNLSNYGGSGNLSVKFAPNQYPITLNGNGSYIVFTDGTNSTNGDLQIITSSGFVGSIDNVSVKEVIDADFDFTRGTAATRVNSQGLVENVQILSGELVQNGDFEQEGSELVTNGNFEQIGSELIPDGNFTNQAAVDYWDIASSRATKSLENGFMRLTYDVAIGAALFKGGLVTSGKSYKVTFRAKGTANSVFNSIGDNANISSNPQYVVLNPTLSSDFQNYEFNVPVSSTTFRFYLASAQIGDTLDITNISVKEVGQNWTFETGWSISDGKLLGTLSNSTNAYQAKGIVAGKIYQITYEISNYSQGGVRFQFAGGGGTVSGTSNSSNGVFTEQLKATVNHTSIRFRGLTTDGGFTGSIDNVSVKEVGQNWSFGTGWSLGNGKAIFNGGNNQSLIQDGIVANNKKYRLTYTILDYVQGGINWRFGTSSNLTTVRSANGTYVEEITSTGSDFRGISSGTSELSIDNVSIIEVTDDTNLPRIDYSPYTGAGTCGHWLLEPQSVNYSTNSAQPSTWHSSSGVTITANATTSPDGTTNSSLVVVNSSSGSIYTRVRLAFSSGSGTQTVTGSCFLKYYNHQFVALGSTFFTGSPAQGERSFFDIQNGVLGTVGANQTAKMENYGNGWYRCSITFDIDKDTDTSGYMQVEPMSGDNTNTYASIGQGFYAFGSQGEELAYMTSYIPTSGATVPRNQDIATNSGSSNLISSTEGVLYCDIAALLQGEDTNRCITLSDGVGNLNTVEIFYQTTTNTIKYRIKDGNGVNFNHTETVADRTQFHKCAIKYKSGDNSMWLDGVKVDTDTSTFSFTTTLSKLNFAQASGSQKFFGKVKSVTVFKEALTDAELTCLTT